MTEEIKDEVSKEELEAMIKDLWLQYWDKEKEWRQESMLDRTSNMTMKFYAQMGCLQTEIRILKNAIANGITKRSHIHDYLINVLHIDRS